jgi:hypothetical protein
MASAAVGITCVGRAPTGATLSSTIGAHGTSPLMATWVWDEATVLEAERRRELLAFARTRSVHVLFVHASVNFEQSPGLEALASLVEAAASQGAEVTLVAGDPSWIFPAHQAAAVAFLDRARRLADRLATLGLSPSRKVLFDVEPYLLPEWKSAPARTAEHYIQFLHVLAQASGESGLDVWHTIPFWFANYEIDRRSLGERVLERSSGVVVMTYRNRVGDVTTLATPILRGADRLRRPVVVAVEMACVELPYVSFCGRTAAEFAGTLRDVARVLGASPAFSGLAVHKYGSWALLPDPSP